MNVKAFIELMNVSLFIKPENKQTSRTSELILNKDLSINMEFNLRFDYH